MTTRRRSSLVAFPLFFGLGLVPFLSLLSVSSGAAQEEPVTTHGLVRVAPTQEKASARALDGLDPDDWIYRLQAADLEEREVHFDALIKAARQDPEVRRFVEDLARETVDPELSWTARLLVRELRRKSSETREPFDLMLRGIPALGQSGQDLGGFFGHLGAPGVHRGPLTPELQKELNQLFRSLGRGSHRLRVPPSAGAPGSSSSARSLRIENTGDGWRVKVRENINGEETTREYSGESLEDIIENNPELALELGAGSGPGGSGGPGGQGGLFHLEIGPELFGGSMSPVLRFQGENGLRGGAFFLRSPSRPQQTDKLGVRISPLPPEDAGALGLEEGIGLVVDSAYPGTLAAILGVAMGDVLVELNERVLRSAADITEALRERDETAPVTLTWIDTDGARKTRTWDPAEETRGTRDF